jgi:DNA transposition AAA+ family ATPase
MNNHAPAVSFLSTKEHRRFVEFCEACRRYRYIGLCYGSPGVGKTLSARTYANWDRIEALAALHLRDRPAAPDILACRTVFYTAPVTTTPQRIEREVQEIRKQFNDLLVEMDQVLRNVHVWSYPRAPMNLVELILVDEADRLTSTGLEQMRDLYDRSRGPSECGLVLIGMPGLEKRLSRYPQLYSRVGFVHHFKPLSSEEISFILQHKGQQLGMSLDLSDFTDIEAVATITRITGGNFRLLQRLLGQVERVMQINELRYVTKEVIEPARELLVIGPSL